MLTSIPAFGFKPNCDCSDMGGQWATTRMLYENGQPTDNIMQDKFNVQLLSGDRDCASFDGWLYSKEREISWKWTGHKDTSGAPFMPSESTSAVGSQESLQLMVTNAEPSGAQRGQNLSKK